MFILILFVNELTDDCQLVYICINVSSLGSVCITISSTILQSYAIELIAIHSRS
jgi:hypothetical protein